MSTTTRARVRLIVAIIAMLAFAFIFFGLGVIYGTRETTDRCVAAIDEVADNCIAGTRRIR